jgi:hypothetical protein
MPGRVPLLTLILAAGCLSCATVGLPDRAGKARLDKPAVPQQLAIPRVELMPNLPQPFRMKDWRATAIAYDKLVFDFNAKGEFLPLVWWDDSRVNIGRATFGLPSYVGSPNATGANHEGITCMSAVLGATIAGIDKSKGEEDQAEDKQER